MRSKFACLLTVALLGGSLAAHADTIQQFNLNATGSNTIYVPSPDGTALAPMPATGTLSVTGTYTIDTTTGAFLAGDVFVDRNGSVTELNSVDFANRNAPGMHPAGIQLSSGVASYPAMGFALAVPNSLVGYMGSILCSDTHQEGDCDSQGSGLIYLTAPGSGYIQYVNGTLTPLSVSATPEPSGIALLGTGLLGIAGIVRRRCRI
jgi:hypothetical protein